MEIIVRGNIDSDHVLAARVRRASQILEDIIGTPVPLVTAEWDLTQYSTGPKQVILTLSDSTGARVVVKFPEDDLVDEARLYPKFYRIWGDLLQYRSHQQLSQLSGGIGTPGQ